MDQGDALDVRRVVKEETEEIVSYRGKVYFCEGNSWLPADCQRPRRGLDSVAVPYRSAPLGRQPAWGGAGGKAERTSPTAWPRLTSHRLVGGCWWIAVLRLVAWEEPSRAGGTGLVVPDHSMQLIARMLAASFQRRTPHLTPQTGYPRAPVLGRPKGRHN